MKEEIEHLEKRIIVLKSTIEGYKRLTETHVKLAEAVAIGHQYEIDKLKREINK